ncbi:hypothetical protein [Salinicoccus bachuensis]|uniref:Uncharacterized protein n=1 Tax=Salinicoccus bachuensis TaxID=3136731 RepID=A0ABZ3CFW0_9STAP
MLKYLLALFSLMMLIGCQNGEEETGSASTESETVSEETTEAETTEESTEKASEETTEENADTEESADDEESSSEESSESDTSSEQASEPEQVNVLATRCIISNLGEACDGVPLDDQKKAYQRLLDEGVLGKREVTDTFLEDVLGSHMTMHNQNTGPSPSDDQYPLSTIDITAHYFTMELENYYNSESDAALGYLEEGSTLYEATVANKESGDFSDYKLYSAEVVESERGEPRTRQIERVYSHASSDGIERDRVTYESSKGDGPVGPTKLQLTGIESHELIETDIEYEVDVNEAYGPASDASPHARECIIKFNIRCELDSVEEVRDAYDQYVANGTLPEETEAESYPARIDESRRAIDYQMRVIGSISTKNYENYFQHYAYDLMQYYNDESDDVLHYLEPDSAAYDAIVANKENGDFSEHENYLVNIDDNRFSYMSPPPQEMILERVYSHATSEGKRKNRVLYTLELDEVSGIQIFSFEELSDEPFEE